MLTRTSACQCIPNVCSTQQLLCSATLLTADKLNQLYVFMQDTVVAIKQGGDELKICNMDEKKYPTATFSIDPKQVSHVLACISVNV